ncbi:hypothetical protein [uncultured Oscillibacter sp.]|uniref:hypothetical protein n=1 Tax=uncultured Oscillibacter sp. TaxID=876091 RepID=UPI0025CEE7F4|nr:hypothetical protein [uncultured Oscillibacter sp.]
MGVFQRIRNGLIRFMYGRNGTDQLNMALLWGYIGICIARMLFSAAFHLEAPAAVCDVLLWALMVLIFFRMFSKNLPKRREENQKWVNWVWGMKNSRAGAKARRADKDHKYFTCKSCKTICRVPVGKGKVVITCPKCGAKIHGKT